MDDEDEIMSQDGQYEEADDDDEPEQFSPPNDNPEFSPDFSSSEDESQVIRILTILSRRRQGQDYSDVDIQSNAAQPENITFDRNLPTSHSYLGEMDECSGVQYIERESYIVLPILQVPNFILVPGQTIPLDVTRPQDTALLQDVLSREDKTFGVIILSRFTMQGTMESRVDYGCTAEMRSMRVKEANGAMTMVGIALGRQRFKIMERHTQPNGNLMAKVQILSEEEPLPPASGAMLNVHRKCYAAYSRRIARNQVISNRSLPVSAGMLTSNPPWTYWMYDSNYLRRLIIDEIRDWYPNVDEVALPLSPSAFSFWTLTHCIMPNDVRLELLKVDGSVRRLRRELEILRRLTGCVCGWCGNTITDRRHIFSMSMSGPVNAYVNPSGETHETLTVYSAKGLLTVSLPSEEHSWFPGYSWTICQCVRCGRHIGWKFIATNTSLVPRTFWGLTRSALQLCLKASEESWERFNAFLRRHEAASQQSPQVEGDSGSTP